MSERDMLQLSIAEARGLMLAAQGLLDPPPAQPPAQPPVPSALEDVRALVERLGLLQIDTISVVARSQYLVVWSRLGAYDPAVLDLLLYPHRAVFEYWGHAASIIPMADYPYYRFRMLHYAEHMWSGHREWVERNGDTMQRTLETVRERGPIASADFERPPDARPSGPWDWHGPKASRRALEILWTTGDLMVHSRRSGQKLYDLRERVLTEAFGMNVPRDDELPGAEDRRRYFVRRTVHALGVVAPSWVWDYFRLAPPAGSRSKRAAAAALLDDLAREGEVVPACIEGLPEPAVVARVLLPALDRLRGGELPKRTTLLSPFDSLIWDRARARALFDYEVCFEAYVPPPRRRYGYYCLAILHHGRIVGRLDPKADRGGRRLIVRSIYLEPGVEPGDDLHAGLAAALRDLARFLDLAEVTVERADPSALIPPLVERLRVW